MVKSQLRTIEGSGKIIIPIEHQYFQVGIFTHRVGQVDPCIGRYREAWSSVRDMCPVPLEAFRAVRSEEHTSELQSPDHLVCRLLLEKKKRTITSSTRNDA